MIIKEYTDQIFSSLDKSLSIPGKKNNKQLYLSLLDQYIPSDSLIIIGGRPRTGKTSLLLDFAARNSDPKKGLIFFVGQKQEMVLGRWFSILIQENIATDNRQDITHLKKAYQDKIKEIEIYFSFIDKASNLALLITEEIERFNPDFVIIDHLNFDRDNSLYGFSPDWNDDELMSKIIQLQKESRKTFLISCSLGHDAWHRSGNKKHCLEDLHSIEIERNADMVLMLHRPELLGITMDEDGSSLEGCVEIESVLNRYGKERISRQWNSIEEIPELVKTS